MNDIFKLRNTDRLTRERYKRNLGIRKSNQATFGKRSLRSYGSKIWNALPYHIKTSDKLNSFKSIMKCWEENYCTCRVCEHTNSRQQTLTKQFFMKFNVTRKFCERSWLVIIITVYIYIIFNCYQWSV